MSATKRSATSGRFENLRISPFPGIALLAATVILLSSARSACAQNESLLPVNRNPQGQQFVSTNQLMAPRKAQKQTERARQDILRGRLESAREELARALEVAPHYAVALTMLGAVNLQSDNIEGAATAFQQATNEDPTLAAAYLGSGMVLMARAKFKEALTPLNRATGLLPGSWYAHLETGLADAGAGNAAAATKEAELAEQFAGTDAERRSGVSYLRAMASAVVKDSGGARKYLDESINRSPDGFYASLAKKIIERAQAGVTIPK